jgi:tRNA pseudouridine38-40 synthase
MAVIAKSRKPSPFWTALTKTTDTPDSTQRIAMTVEYDGSDFNGWQLQRGSSARSVQGVLEKAIGEVANTPLRIVCAGRTDTGVHATSQVIHFDSPNIREPRSWLLGGNANLPDTVAVRTAQLVDDAFHARFSALSRRYRYLIFNRDVRTALAPRHLTWIRQAVDVEAMQREAQALLGERDFSSFRAAACQSGTPMRHVDFIEVFRSGPLIVVDIQANAFLYHMVRNIVGALLAVGRGRLDPGGLAELLALKDRTRAPDTAPANGLYLVQVNYPPVFGIQTVDPGPVFLPPEN